jgi:hypothetical protein
MARAGVFPGDSVPDRVHLRETRHVGNPDNGGEQLGLVGPGRSQEAIDLRPNRLAHTWSGLGIHGDIVYLDKRPARIMCSDPSDMKLIAGKDQR